MMDKYDKEEMLKMLEAMLYQLGADVSCEELDHFFTQQGQNALRLLRSGSSAFAVEKMLSSIMHARDETLAKQVRAVAMLASRG